jgi:hypothetical protein
MDCDYSFLSFLGDYSHPHPAGPNIKNEGRRIALGIDDLTTVIFESDLPPFILARIDSACYARFPFLFMTDDPGLCLRDAADQLATSPQRRKLGGGCLA